MMLFGMVALEKIYLVIGKDPTVKYWLCKNKDGNVLVPADKELYYRLCIAKLASIYGVFFRYRWEQNGYFFVGGINSIGYFFSNINSSMA